ncbi:MAG TPA: aminotransferase class V-fold PLP-dependent enzyme [Bacteroidales bacterium]|nr:aminotransferase class V-fold PLP-dependent enzyme [Bacteroidales bacterium]
MIYNFKSDYSEGAHPDIIKALSNTNTEQLEGYGEDKYCLAAADKIRKELDSPGVDVHFVSGGTQANLLCISSFLKPYESVIAAQTAHIEVHEAGAIEFTGHKINKYPGLIGKLTPEQIQFCVDFHYDEHMVVPRLVFISNTTELGTVYRKKELEAIYEVCKKNNLLLYIDGARLGQAMKSYVSDVSLADIAKFADAFYIGGTKNGALIGEAVVITNPDIKPYFRYNMKQKGALLAKGRVVGIQFNELFRNGLYYKLAEHANNMAMNLANGIESAGYKFLAPPESNQIFPIFPNKLIENLSENFGFYIWSKHSKKTSVARLVCSWATKEDAIKAFLKSI